MNSSDPRLTAYAFGELHGEEKARFEAELAGSEALRHELAQIRETIALLGADLMSRPASGLDSDRRRRIASAAKRPARIGPNWAFRGAAAVVAIAAGSVLVVNTFGTAVTNKFENKATHIDSLGEPGVVPPSLASAAPAPTATYESPAQFLPDPALRGARGDGKADGDRRFNREAYDKFDDNPFIHVATDPRSTFSIDVDTASYALVRRHLNDGVLPPKGAVRIEELLNYFKYAYPEPEPGRPFAVQTEVGSAPWASEHRLLRIGIKGKHVAPADVPGTNLVFLIDVSGSMNDENKLPLLKRAFSLLVQQLGAEDRVSIVVYAGASGLVLPPTRGNNRSAILAALERLQSGGSTNGGEGIRLAYQTASEQLVKGGINRVILATDGDFNVGVTSQSELVDLVEQKAKSGVFLSVLGFGGGNYNDSMLEKLADKGNGNYAYIDTLAEARKVLVEQATGTLMTIAKDVKIQIELNPESVEAFRLIGYENRVLAHQDFNDDKKDAGDIGADHTVTALYELVPAGRGLAVPGVDPLKYQAPGRPNPAAKSGELATIKLRYKLPDGDRSELFEVVVRDGGARSGSADFRFAAAVAQFGMLLRDSPYKGSASYEQIVALASDVAHDELRREFIGLAKRARGLAPR
jgi:Ca-activated chloride channel homolog